MALWHMSGAGVAWCAAVGAGVLSGTARADVITFESLDGLHNPAHASLAIDGYVLSTQTQFQTMDEDPGSVLVHNASEVTLARNYGEAAVTLRRADGSGFSLRELDVGGLWKFPWNGGPSADHLILTGERADGSTVTEILTLGTGWAPPFAHYVSAEMTGVVAVTFEGTRDGAALPAAFQLDNLRVEAVPAPLGAALAGIAGAWATRRRR